MFLRLTCRSAAATIVVTMGEPPLTEQLRELVARHDLGTAAALLRRTYGPEVRAFVAKQLRGVDESVLDDVCQEVWKAVVENVDSFRGEGDDGPAAPLTWICAIGKYKAVDYLRRKGRQRPTEPLESVISRLVLSSAKGPSREAAVHEQQRIVTKLIDELHPVERTLLVWRYSDGCMPGEWLERIRREGCAATMGIEKDMTSYLAAEGEEKARVARVIKDRLMKRLERAVAHTVDRWAALDVSEPPKSGS